MTPQQPQFPIETQQLPWRNTHTPAAGQTCRHCIAGRLVGGKKVAVEVVVPCTMKCGLIFLAPVRGGVMAGWRLKRQPCQPLRNNSRCTFSAWRQYTCCITDVKMDGRHRTFWTGAAESRTTRTTRTAPTQFSLLQVFFRLWTDPRFAGLLPRMIINALPPIRPETRPETLPIPRDDAPPAVWQWQCSCDPAGAAASRESG